jgi:hypothetical protein
MKQSWWNWLCTSLFQNIFPVPCELLFRQADFMAGLMWEMEGGVQAELPRMNNCSYMLAMSTRMPHQVLCYWNFCITGSESTAESLQEATKHTWNLNKWLLHVELRYAYSPDLRWNRFCSSCLKFAVSRTVICKVTSQKGTLPMTVPQNSLLAFLIRNIFFILLFDPVRQVR